MNSSKILSLGVSTLCLACTLDAQVLMFDFGPTAAADDSRVNSPYHAVAGSTGNAWNTVAGAYAGGATFVWSNGADATDIEIDLGQTTTAAGRTILLASTPTQNALGGGSNTGVYADTSVAKDGIFPTSTGTRAVGVQVTGLDAGLYDVYITARNTNQNSQHYQTVYAGATAEAGDFDFSGYQFGSLSFSSSAVATETWEENGNYVKLSVSLAAGQALNIASIGGLGGSGDRGFLNSVQIVAVPEPSAFAALGGLGALTFAATRRRRA